MILLILALGLPGCGDDAATPSDTEGSTGPGTSTAPPTTTMTTAPGDTTMMMADSSTGEPMGSSSSEEGGESSTSGGPVVPPMPADFCVRIENISDEGLLATPFSPGVWANHDSNNNNFFTPLEARPGEGLELLAENGDPSELADAIPTHLGFHQTGVFDTPVGEAAAGPILPGQAYEFTFTADPCPVGSECADNGGGAFFTRLSLATMLGASNDLLVATGTNGVGLFNGNGSPMGTRDISSSLAVWDVGTEVNQAPGQGPNQAPFSGVNIGPPEDGGVFPFASSTRAIPLAAALVDVQVDQGDGVEAPANEYTFTITNHSGSFGTLVSPLSGLVWVAHDDTVTLFDDGGAASAELEALAEDGDTTPYETLLGGGVAGIDQFAVAAGAQPSEQITFTVTADAAGRFLSFATMVGQTNDAFLAMAPAGVALLEEDGTPRDNQDIETEILASLGVWDAGTEANEAPGVGLNQAPRQVAPGDGLADGNATIRRYSDITNDLDAAGLPGFLTVVVEDAAGGGLDYDVTITNTSDTTAFPGVLSPAAWAVHDDTVMLFEIGTAASAGLEGLAEDGDAAGLEAELAGTAGVGTSGVGGAGPLLPGDSVTFTVTPDATNRFLSLASMIVPSNDAFVAFDAGGIALLTAAGAQRTNEAIAADIAGQLAAWDAGTENNQAGGAGADMAPTGMANTGPSEGTGVVRNAEDDPVWPVPEPANIIRVMVGPVADLCP